MGANSTAVHNALKDSLPENFAQFIDPGSMGLFTWDDTPDVTDKDSATIAMGRLSRNLNTLFKLLFERITIPELMCYAASLNPALEGLLLASLSLRQGDLGFEPQTGVTPVTVPDPDTGDPVDTGSKHITITPQQTGLVGAESYTIELPSLGASATIAEGGLADFVVDSADAVGRVYGKVIATYKDGIQVAKDFWVDLLT